jgi:hypothetical protein
MKQHKDLCKGVRQFYNAILKIIVKSPLLSGLLMGLPTYFLLSGIIAGFSLIPFFTYASSYVFSLFAFTIISWILELWAIRKTLPNLLHICAFFHSAIGSWWFVNFFIFLFAGWKYIPIGMMWNVLMLLLTPSVIWYVTGDIIIAYKRKQINEIETSQQIDKEFITGAEKV